MTQFAAITQLAQIRSFLLAGHAKFTLVSKKTGDRKTFRVRENEKGEFKAFFVDLLVGPNNDDDYKYLGYLFPVGLPEQLKFTQNKERWGTDAFAAFLWLTAWLNGRPGIDDRAFFEQAEFWHAGECGRCGRELTDPESIARGLGPVCAERS